MPANLSIKNWSRRVKNAAAALLFLTAYTISAVGPFVPAASAIGGEQCVTDTAGANDEPGQKDLTKLCVNYDDVPNTVVTKFNWDETGTNGANTMDACNLFDTDGDGNINYAVCLTTENDPAQLQFYKTYSCGDDKIDRCTSPATEISSGSTVCEVNQVTNDPFASGTSYPKDTEGTCTVYLSTVGGSSAKLIDVCSFPSNQPNSDPSDCVIARPNAAKLEVIKALNPSSDSGRFNLRINGTTYATDIGDGGTTGTQVVTVDNQHPTQTILEEANSTTNPTSLANYATTVVCKDQHGTGAVVGSSSPTGSTTRQLTVTIAAESDVVCVFTNTRSMGNIKVIKDVVNDNGGTKTYADFSFDLNGQNYSFDETTSPDGAKTVSLPTGTYSVTEPEANTMGYSTSYNNCTDIQVVANQTATCTITNDDNPGKLIVKKVVENHWGGTKEADDFSFSVNGGNATDFEADGQNDLTVSAGTYSVTEPEANTDGYATSYDNCTDVSIGLGETATCTITNSDQPAKLVLQKTVVNNNGGTLSADDFPVFIGNTQSSWGVTYNLVAGAHSVHETPDPNYTASSWGTDCAANGDVTLVIGQTKTCTITNDDKPASLSGYKYEVNADATDGTGAVGLPNWTICLDENKNGLCDNGEPTATTDASGAYSFTNLTVGEYALAESLGGSMDGWTQIFAPQPVSLSLGENSTGNDFGNFKNASISGYKFNDHNGNGTEDTGDEHLSGWEITLYDSQKQVVAQTTTDGNGYSFSDITPGTYTICETGKNGWVQTYPSNDACHEVTIDESGEANDNSNFGNQGQATLTVIKNVDDGFGNVTKDASGWTWDYSGSYDSSSNENADSANTITVAADTYTLHEDQQTNYHFTSVSCTKNGQGYIVTQAESFDVAVSAGDAVVCTFTNTRDTANITVTKIVNNKYGGDAEVSDFDLYVNKTKVTSGVTNSFLADAEYTVDEIMNVSGYTQTSIKCWTGDISLVQLGATFTLSYGNDVTCEITNDDKPASLSGYKYEVNAGATDGTGATGLAGWTICIDENDNGKCDNGEPTTTTAADGSYSFTGLTAGTYYLAEANTLGGTVEGWTQIFAPQPVVLVIDQSSENNDFGNFENGDIHGYKWNDLNGDGSKTSDEPKLKDWTIFIDENSNNILDQNERSTTTDVDGYYTFDNLAPGSYTICEVMQTGWIQTYPDTQSKCSSRTINVSGESEFVKFGNQGRATITITKDLRPSGDPGLFNLLIDGQTKATNVGNTGTTGVIEVAAGLYSISEAAGAGTTLNNYASSLSCSLNGGTPVNYGLVTSQDDIAVGPGDSLDCTFTNIRKTAKITVTKKVLNTYGGTATAADFAYFVNNVQVQSGAANYFNINETYDISEALTKLPYLLEGISCKIDKSTLPRTLQYPSKTFELLEGDEISCEVVNQDIAPELTVYKYVDNGFTNLTNTSGDFTIYVDGTNVSNDEFAGDSNGTTVTLNAGTYEVTEGDHTGYSMWTSGACDTSIAVGEEKTCYIYNEAIEDPQINVVKSGPTQAHEGDTVTYTFEVTNPGNVPFPDVQVEDTIAGTATYVSGDTNGDWYLDPGETWLYTANYVIPADQVDDVYNVVEACGSYGYFDDYRFVEQESEGYRTVCDDDDHTLDVLHPSVMVEKDGPANALLGSTGTYTFTVTNTGDIALELTKVLDTIAGVGVYQSGDTNDDGMLDLTETWVYTATYKFTQLGDVVNTVTVCGTDPLQMEVCDDDSHTTIVYQPQVLGLEDTGDNFAAPLFLSSGFLGLAIVTMLNRRKHGMSVK